jgi:hypothetical protein
MASEKGWAAHDVAALFGFLKNNLEIHDNKLISEAKKSFREINIKLLLIPLRGLLDSKLAPEGPLQHRRHERVQLGGNLWPGGNGWLKSCTAKRIISIHRPLS